jgi:hypothetical protein
VKNLRKVSRCVAGVLNERAEDFTVSLFHGRVGALYGARALSHRPV